MLRFVLAAVLAALALAGVAEAKPVWRHYPPYTPLPTRFVVLERPASGPVWLHYRAPRSLAAETTSAPESPAPPVATAARAPNPSPPAAAAEPVVVAAEAPEAKPAAAEIAATETRGSSDPRGPILLGLFFSVAVLAAIFLLSRRGLRRA